MLTRLREAVFAAIASILFSLLWHTPFFNAPPSPPEAYLSNGTHAWAPTVLLLSLDGFKPKYLRSGHVPTLTALSKGRWPLSDTRHTSLQMLSSPYMLPVSPSLTFPNHWSLLTGLQPSSHGIIANDFHLAPLKDGRRRFNSSFYYTDPNQSWDPKWWRGTPIWEHLVTKGYRTANLMWPGPPVTSRRIRSTIFQKYEKDWTLGDRHDRIMSWLDMETDQRPQFVCAYAPDVDTATHGLGPDPKIKEVANALRRVDKYVYSLLQSIAARNASSIVNVVVVSDHGMTFTSNKRLLYLDDILGADVYRQILTQDGWPSAGLRFRSETIREAARQRMMDEQQRWKRRGIKAFDIVGRDRLVQLWNWTMTETVKERVAELWMVPRVGWSITTHREMVALDDDYKPRGNHGYDATHPDMHAFFLAAGPAIVRRESTRMEPFANVEIHNLVSAILGVEGAPNNGTDGFWSGIIRAPGR